MSSLQTRTVTSCERNGQQAYPVDHRKEYERLSYYEEHDPSKLSFFQMCLFATILEHVIAQLRILDECNSELRIVKTMGEMNMLLARKYGVAGKAVKDELDNVDPKKLDCLEYKLNKLQADRNLVIRVLIETYLDLARSRKYQALVQNVHKILARDAYFKNLCEEEFKNRTLRRELNRQLRQQRNHFKSVTYDSNAIIDSLKTRLEDSDLNSEIRTRYVMKWQGARAEQNLQKISDKEVKPIQNITYFKLKVDQECRVHTEVEVLFNIKINEILEKVEHWMSKYDKDMEHMDLKIQLKKNEYQHMYDRRMELEETLEKHTDLIKHWVAFKEERQASRQYEINMNHAATVVQAWWRGLLVRQQLGPYKVVKRRAPPKPEEKEKKKKKK